MLVEPIPMVDLQLNPEYMVELIANTQEELDSGIPWLLGKRANYLAIRLRPCYRIDLHDYPEHVDWIIVEGGQEPLHPAWVRAVRDACTRFDCPFSFVSWGEWQPYLDLGNDIWQTMDGKCYRLVLDWADKKTWQEWHDGVGIDLSWDEPGVMFQRVGAGKSGRMLDGVEWVELPEKYVADEPLGGN